MLNADSISVALNDPNQKWGDVLWDDIQKQENEGLPVLSRISDIWRAFPVHVIMKEFMANSIVYSVRLDNSKFNRQSLRLYELQARMLRACANNRKWHVFVPTEDTTALLTICVPHLYGNVKTLYELRHVFPIEFKIYNKHELAIVVDKSRLPAMLAERGQTFQDMHRDLFLVIRSNKMWLIQERTMGELCRLYVQ
jgi:hypothetical protein